MPRDWTAADNRAVTRIARAYRCCDAPWWRESFCRRFLDRVAPFVRWREAVYTQRHPKAITLRDDLFQEGWIAAYRALLDFDASKGHLWNAHGQPYVDRAMIDLHKQKAVFRSKMRGMVGEDGETFDVPDRREGGAPDRLVASESNHALSAALRELPESRRETVVAWLLCRCEGAEVGRLLGISREAVRQRLDAAKGQLRDRLDPADFGLAG